MQPPEVTVTESLVTVDGVTAVCRRVVTPGGDYGDDQSHWTVEVQPRSENKWALPPRAHRDQQAAEEAAGHACRAIAEIRAGRASLQRRLMETYEAYVNAGHDA